MRSSILSPPALGGEIKRGCGFRRQRSGIRSSPLDVPLEARQCRGDLKAGKEPAPDAGNRLWLAKAEFGQGACSA